MGGWDAPTSVGLAFGLVGTVLGVITLARQLWQDRVRLRVCPSIGILTQTGEDRILVTVTNLSAFSLQISSVVLTAGKREQVFTLHATTADGLPIQRTLHPRHSFMVIFPRETFKIEGADRINGARATTSCGTVKTTKQRGFHRVVAGLAESHA